MLHIYCFCNEITTWLQLVYAYPRTIHILTHHVPSTFPLKLVTQHLHYVHRVAAVSTMPIRQLDLAVSHMPAFCPSPLVRAKDIGDLGELGEPPLALRLARRHQVRLWFGLIVHHGLRTRLNVLLEVGDHLRRRLQHPKEVFQVSVALDVLLPMLILACRLVKHLIISKVRSSMTELVQYCHYVQSI